MFIEIAEGDFIALDTVARISHWRETAVVGPNHPNALIHTDENGWRTFYTERTGYRVETKRGEKHSVTDPVLVAKLAAVISAGVIGDE
jgi:hypothetical protein